MTVLARITAPHFVCGIVLERGVVIEAAPIVHYLRGWNAYRVHDYVSRKGWDIERAPSSDDQQVARPSVRGEPEPTAPAS